MKGLWMVFLIGMSLPVIGQIDLNWASKIDAEDWAKAQVQKETEFFVYLKDQANTTGAKNLPTKGQKGAWVYQSLKDKAADTQTELVAILEREQVWFQSYYIINGILVRGDASLMRTMAEQPTVAEIIRNPIVYNTLPQDHSRTSSAAPTTITWGITQIKADLLWQQQIKGAGVVVGGQDTGYEWFHPAIKQQYRGDTTNHNYHWHDAIHVPFDTSRSNSCGYDSKFPCDDGSHGTHTMGTMVGDDGMGNQIGVAPEASWIGCRNMDNGWGTPATYIECFEWFLAPTDTNDLNPDPSKAPHVIANSWGCPVSEGCNPSNFHIMQQAIRNLRNAGVFIEVSAGNSGPSCESINNPAAIYPESFTVGATDIADELVSFSSRGAVSVDSSFRLKPNVVAPGRDVGSCVPGNGYARYSGTSMAGPHVAGAVALLISAQPSLAGNVDSLETILEMTADTILAVDTCGNTLPTQIPNNMVGYGRINLYRALQVVRPDLFIGVEQIAAPNQLQVYPNPFDEQLYLTTTMALGESQVTLLNAMGQVVWQKKLTLEQEESLSLANLPSGVYILQIQTKDTPYVSKIIKQ